jgi:hypothetical protein
LRAASSGSASQSRAGTSLAFGEGFPVVAPAAFGARTGPASDDVLLPAPLSSGRVAASLPVLPAVPVEPGASIGDGPLFVVLVDVPAPTAPVLVPPCGVLVDELSLPCANAVPDASRNSVAARTSERGIAVTPELEWARGVAGLEARGRVPRRFLEDACADNGSRLPRDQAGGGILSA